MQKFDCLCLLCYSTSILTNLIELFSLLATRLLGVSFILAGAECFVKCGCQPRWLLSTRELKDFRIVFRWINMRIIGANALSRVCYNKTMAYIRRFKTTSGATGVQVCYKEQGRVVRTVHVGSASSEKSLEKLLRKAQGIIDSEKGTPMFNLDRFNKK